jgi:hypothetical protein
MRATSEIQQCRRRDRRPEPVRDSWTAIGGVAAPLKRRLRATSERWEGPCAGISLTVSWFATRTISRRVRGRQLPLVSVDFSVGTSKVMIGVTGVLVTDLFGVEQLFLQVRSV